MIQNQQTIIFSPYTAIYDFVVPKDNLLRKINDLVNFSFVYDELKDQYCFDNGRNAIDPIRMFKYLLLKFIYDLSDVDVVERSKFTVKLKRILKLIGEDQGKIPLLTKKDDLKFRFLNFKDVFF